MSKVCIFLADGFEEIEGLTVVDILRRAGIEIRMVSVTGKKEIVGSHGISLQADMLFEDLEETDVDVFVLPGGMPGTKTLGAHEGLGKMLVKAFQEGKRIAAICAAPSVLGGLGILKGKKAACYPGFEEKLEGASVVYDPVVTDGMVTTSRGMGTAIEFALELTALLKDRESADALGKAIIWNLK